MKEEIKNNKVAERIKGTISTLKNGVPVKRIPLYSKVCEVKDRDMDAIHMPRTVEEENLEERGTVCRRCHQPAAVIKHRKDPQEKKKEEEAKAKQNADREEKNRRKRLQREEEEQERARQNEIRRNRQAEEAMIKAEKERKKASKKRRGEEFKATQKADRE